MGTEIKQQSWWYTLPGVLTAVGATITALAGLIAVLHQSGLIGASRNANKPPATETRAVEPAADRAAEEPVTSISARTSTVPATSPSTTSVAPSPASAAPPSVGTDTGAAMSMTEVNLGGAIFQFLNVAVEKRTPDSVTARFNVRMTNTGRYPANFWDANFRMLIDGIPRAPTSGLNEAVAGEAAKEGEVTFVVPVTARSTVLRVRFGEESADIPVELAKARPTR
jgi:hypothetical protein